MSENKAPAATSDQGAEEQKVPVLVRWRGLGLRPNGYGAFESGDVRVGADGHVYQLKGCRVDVTTAPRFGTGMHDGWALDTLSGHVVAWRGVSKLTVSTGHFAEVLTLDGYQVVFGHDMSRTRGHQSDHIMRPLVPHGRNDWLGTMGPLVSGEVMLDTRRPKSLVRRVRRARQAGGREIPGTSLLLLKRTTVAEWPPAPRNRNKRGKPHSLAWDAKGHYQDPKQIRY